MRRKLPQRNRCDTTPRGQVRWYTSRMSRLLGSCGDETMRFFLRRDRRHARIRKHKRCTPQHERREGDYLIDSLREKKRPASPPLPMINYKNRVNDAPACAQDVALPRIGNDTPKPVIVTLHDTHTHKRERQEQA